MKLEGIWEGVLYINELREFIEGEAFRIEILSVDSGHRAAAIVTEEKQFTGLIRQSSLKGQMLSYQATGSLNPEKAELRLKPTEKSLEQGIPSVEITGTLDPGGKTIKGNYCLTVQPGLQAEFLLKKKSAEKERGAPLISD